MPVLGLDIVKLVFERLKDLLILYLYLLHKEIHIAWLSRLARLAQISWSDQKLICCPYIVAKWLEKLICLKFDDYLNLFWQLYAFIFACDAEKPKWNPSSRSPGASWSLLIHMRMRDVGVIRWGWWLEIVKRLGLGLGTGNRESKQSQCWQYNLMGHPTPPTPQLLEVKETSYNKVPLVRMS